MHPIVLAYKYSQSRLAADRETAASRQEAVPARRFLPRLRLRRPAPAPPPLEPTPGFAGAYGSGPSDPAQGS